MQEAHIDRSELDRLVGKLAKSPQIIREAKRQAFAAAAPKLRDLVREAIGGSGRVRDWQEAYVGSGGGYAAARPKAKTWAEAKGHQTYSNKGPKRHAVGYITNSINSGHRAPRDKWGYRRSARTVSGKYFYQWAQGQAKDVAQEAGKQIVGALLEHLEG